MWTGYYSCQEPGCTERFIFQRENLDFPEGVYFQVHHSHAVEPPRWEGVLYRHEKGQRYPQEVKSAITEISEQRKKTMKKRSSKNIHTREKAN